MLELIDEPLPSVVEKQTTNTTECFRGQKLDLRIGIVGVNETGGVHLNLFEVDCVRTYRQRKLVAVTCAVLAIGSREIPQLGTVLLQERVGGEVRSVTTSRKDDRTVCGLSLTVMLILDTDYGTRLVLYKLADACLLLDLDTVGGTLCKVLQAFHLSVGDDHTGELGAATVRTRLRLSTETSDFRKVEAKLVLEPVNSISRTSSEDADEVVPCKFAGLGWMWRH